MSPTKTIGPKLRLLLPNLPLEGVVARLLISRTSTAFRQIHRSRYRVLRHPRSRQSRILTMGTHHQTRISQPVRAIHLPVPALPNHDASLRKDSAPSRIVAVPFHNFSQTTPLLLTTKIRCHQMSGNVHDHPVSSPNPNLGTFPTNEENRM